MTRVLSALVILPIVVGVIWFLPPVATLLLALAALVPAFLEYVGIAAQLGARVPTLASGIATLTACAALGWPGAPVEVAIMAATLAVWWDPLESTCRHASLSIL